MKSFKVKKFGEYLIEAGLLKEDELLEYLKKAKEEGLRLGDYLVKHNILTLEQIYSTLSKQLGILYVTDYKDLKISEDVLRRFDADFIINNRLVPINEYADSVWVVFDDPLRLNWEAVSQIIETLKKTNVEFIIAPSSVIDEIFSRFFSGHINIEVDGNEVGLFLDKILRLAIEKGATDIHIEALKDIVRIRMRVDGVLREIDKMPIIFADNILRVIKVRSNLDLSITSLPQDGRFVFVLDSREYEIRVATIPTLYKESAVLRILNKEDSMFDLFRLGFDNTDIEKIKQVALKQAGLVVISGPTGSGKTTTLYAIFKEYIDGIRRKIITLENPVEYEMYWAMQININETVGLTFSRALKSVLRLDPDVILVGETRDTQTAQLVAEASLTGHLVWTTLHAYDVFEIPIRLIDMGVEPYILASTFYMGLAQRLLKTLCPYCKEPLKEQAYYNDLLETNDITYYHSVGCEKCNFTGVGGRTLVYQMLEANETVGKLIYESAAKHEFINELKLPSLKDKALDLAKRGIISPAEVISLI